MRRPALIMLVVLIMLSMASMPAWAQTPRAASDAPAKPDRATAYYHYMLAHLYAELAFSSTAGNREYADKAMENLKAAVKADPQSTLLAEELARGPLGRFPINILRSPSGPRQPRQP